jgi:hypothetical protein
LSKRNGGQLFLDLYQAKHYKKLPSANSPQIRKAFASLGVSYDQEVGLFETMPTTGTAGYSYLGTMKLVEELEEILGEEVKIRNRVLVFSNPKEKFVNADTWPDFPWDYAKHKNIWIWSREMLEPTISALVPWRTKRF